MKKYVASIICMFLIQNTYANEGGKILSNAFEGIMIMVLMLVGVIVLLLLAMKNRKKD